MSNENSMKDFVVMNGGEIDRDATLDRFESALDVEIEMRAKDQTVLSEALQSFWAENPGLSANTPAIITTVLASVGFTPKSYDRLRTRLAEVIKNDDRHYTVKGAGASSGLNRMSDAEYNQFKVDGLNPQQRVLAARKLAKSSK